MFSYIPTGNLTERSAYCKDIFVGMNSPILSFSQMDNGIKLTLDPKSHKALSITIFPSMHGMENYLGLSI